MRSNADDIHGSGTRHTVELEGEVTLPEGTRVCVIPEQPVNSVQTTRTVTLEEWIREARKARSLLPQTSDSTDLLRSMREERASR
jgi:hypothetical protein